MTSEPHATRDRPLVLVVDDDPGVLEMLGRVARREGYDVITCTGGQQALGRMSHFERTLKRTGGNKAAAARILGLSRRAFYRRLERHGLAESPVAEPPSGQPDR